MSYIAFDLDALNVCPQVGAACGLSAAEASHGLLQLWAWCFRTESDIAADVHLRGFFHGKDAGPALEAFGFLERSEGSWRVRGAARYLRIKTAQREAGKRTQNLKRGRKKPGATPKVHPEVHPNSTSGSGPALTPTTDDRRPNTESTTGPAPKKRAVDPRLSPLIGKLKEAFFELTSKPYFASDPDVGALRGLLGKGTDEEILSRWCKGLCASQFETKCSSFLQLAQRWNDLGIERGAPTKPQADPNAGIIERVISECAVCGRGASARAGATNILLCYPHLSEGTEEARRLNPSKPWTVDLTQWVEEQRNERATA